jgi:hypothetical protein
MSDSGRILFTLPRAVWQCLTLYYFMCSSLFMLLKMIHKTFKQLSYEHNKNTEKSLNANC